MSDGYRQEVFNVLLAQLLEKRGVIAAPENILKSEFTPGKRMPDVLVDFNGLRTVIEGEVSDNPYARERALESARKRVEEGIAHIGVAVVYPKALRSAAFPRLKSILSKSELEIAIVTESGEGDWAAGTVDQLETALRQAFDQLVREDVVARAVAVLGAGVERFALSISGKEGILGRVSEILGIRELPHDDPPHQEEDE